MDFAHIWDIASNWIAGVALVATFLGAVEKILGQGRGISAWRERKRERNRKLDELLETTERLECTADHEKQLQELSQGLACLTTNVSNLATQVTRHEEHICESLEERRHLSRGVLALLENAIDNGANGVCHGARDALSTYLQERAHNI